MSDMILHDDRDTIIAGLRQQLKDAREELAAEHARHGGVEDGAARLRQLLGPLYGALGQVFGEIKDMDVAEVSQAPNASGGSDPRVKAAWDNWKTRLSPMAGRFIDALMVHGSVNRTQLRIAVGCGESSVTNTIYELNKAGLINKNGNKVSLKEL
jgi:hypothetical protein